MLDQKREAVNLSRKQNENLDSVIESLLDEAFDIVEPTEEALQLHDKYNRISYKEKEESRTASAARMMADMVYQETGLILDLESLKGAPDIEKMEQQLKAQIEAKEAEEKNRKKSAKELKMEAMEQQKAALKKKSLRSIYLSLAKILHPDTEPDPNLKSEKENTLKAVTSAYEKGDMVTLLLIEKQWVKKMELSLETMDTNTIQVYISLLKDQVRELEAELEMVYFNPAHVAISDYKYEGDYLAFNKISSEALSLEANATFNTDIIEKLEGSEYPSTAIKACINYYYEEDLWAF